MIRSTSAQLHGSRRAVLGGGAAATAVLVSGCSLDLDGGRDDRPRETPVEIARDVDLGVRLATRIRLSTDLIARALRATPALRPRFAGLLAAQRGHERLLLSMLPSGSRPSAPAGAAQQSTAASAAQLSRRARQDRSMLVQAALDAEDGEFAQLLASMAASIGQHQIAGRLPR